MKMNPGMPMIRRKYTEMTNDQPYFKNIDDEYLKSLPVKIFPGTINLIDHPSACERIKHILAEERIIGFDTETKPSFKRGQYHRVALLQLSTSDQAFLLRLNKMHLPEYIIDILEDSSIIKVGVALKDDLNGLKKVMDLDPDGFIDLQQFVKQFGIEDNGLKKLVANILGFRISKKLQTSNWELDLLSKEQLEYAATDAWVCRQMYEVLINHRQV
jgi:ribonuclease D